MKSLTLRQKGSNLNGHSNELEHEFINKASQSFLLILQEVRRPRTDDDIKFIRKYDTTIEVEFEYQCAILRLSKYKPWLQMVCLELVLLAPHLICIQWSLFTLRCYRLIDDIMFPYHHNLIFTLWQFNSRAKFMHVFILWTCLRVCIFKLRCLCLSSLKKIS